MYGSVDVWMCGCVDVWMCGCVAVWLCGCVVVWIVQHSTAHGTAQHNTAQHSTWRYYRVGGMGGYALPPSHMYALHECMGVPLNDCEYVCVCV